MIKNISLGLKMFQYKVLSYLLIKAVLIKLFCFQKLFNNQCAPIFKKKNEN